MNPVLKNVLAVIAGIVVGGFVNMGLITLGQVIIPPPEGTDVSTMEGIAAAMPLFTFKNFIFIFLAHAGGSLVGAFTAAKIAANNQRNFALLIGAFFLLGGITMVMKIPAPLWFEALDLLVAYLPMGWLGYQLASRKNSN